ncbi:hypothetical protein, partial [Campylobacter coli]|uniref:hypothetical protein n=1 Tax=Campylobacter coli TaxID=195 RepID=UPI00071077D0
MTQVFKNSNSIQVKEQKNKENHFNLMLQLSHTLNSVSYTHLRAHETPEHLVCRLLLEKKKNS